MASVYDIKSWYWLVTDSSPGTQVFSSKDEDFVPLANAGYVAWLAADGGNNPNTMATAAELWQIFDAYAQAAWANGGFSQQSTSVDLTLTNPLRRLTVINETGSNKKVILPCMRSPKAPPIGTPFIVKNDAASTQPFTIYQQDGTTVVKQIYPGSSVNLTLTANTTKNGALETTVVFPFGWTQFNPNCASEFGAITSFVGQDGAYKRAGDTVFFWTYAVINNPGTGAGGLFFGLPAAIAIPLAGPTLQMVPVRISEAGVDKAGVAFFVNGGGGSMNLIKVYRYDNATPIGAGHGIYLSGSYQVA